MSEHTPRSESGHVLGLVIGLTALLTVLLVAFAWPSSQLGPRQLPVAVAGPPELVVQVERLLARALGDDALDVRPVASREQAVALVEQRETYGALLLTPTGPEVLVASAGSPAAAQLLTDVGRQIAADGSPTVTDVVPLPAGDPRGAVLGSGAFPLVIGGIAAAGALALQVPRRGARALGALGVAVAAGLALTAVLQVWLDALAGVYLLNAAVVALGLAAVALPLLGLHRLLGTPGLGLGTAAVLLLGNPLSAVTSAPELLPGGWSTLGQLLPPGAVGSALRSVAFFDGAGALVPLLVLAGWCVLGLLMLLVPGGGRDGPAGRRTREPEGAGHPTAA